MQISRLLAAGGLYGRPDAEQSANGAANNAPDTKHIAFVEETAEPAACRTKDSDKYVDNCFLAHIHSMAYKKPYIL